MSICIENDNIKIIQTFQVPTVFIFKLQQIIENWFRTNPMSKIFELQMLIKKNCAYVFL